MRAVLSAIEFVDAVHACAHIGKKCIGDGESCHGFHNNYGTWNNNRIMASFDLKLQIFAGAGYGGLGLADRWCWFDMGTEDNVTAVTHTAHDTACMVGGLGNDAVFLDKTVVVFGTGKTCQINTSAATASAIAR